MTTFNTPFIVAHDNDVDAFIPEVWANESLAILEEHMVAGNLVHRDFEPEIADFGDVVNTRQPGEFESKRKGADDDVTIQDVEATNVPVTLNQHVHASFMIRDSEASKSFKELVYVYLVPAMIAQARFVDQVVLGQYGQFLPNAYGGLRSLSSSNVKSRILNTRNLLNVNKAYMQGRNLIWTPSSETSASELDLFTAADQTGDGGFALSEASLGRKLGFDNYMCQNMTGFGLAQTDYVTGAVNQAAGEGKGETAITVDGLSAAIANGQWVDIAGDPHRVVSTTGGSTPTVITVAAPGLRQLAANDAVVIVYGKGAVNKSSGYAAGYAKDILVDGFTNFPVVGQMLSFGTSPTSAIYTVIQASSANGTVLLDRPLEAALSNDDNANIGPAGEYNFAFHKNALALVVRPLATPRAGTGALSSVANYNGLSMRATITYNGTKQGHLVTLDMLMGVKVLNTDLGAILLG